MNRHLNPPGAASLQTALTEEFARFRLASGLLGRYRNWRRRAMLNRLENLDDRMLEDIGITRLDLVWARSLPLTRNPLSALDAVARDRTRQRRRRPIKALPGTGGTARNPAARSAA